MAMLEATGVAEALVTPRAETFAQPYGDAREHLNEQLGKVQRWLERHRLLFPDRYEAGTEGDSQSRLTAIARELEGIERHLGSRESASARAGVRLPLWGLKGSLGLSPVEIDLLVGLAAAECEPDFHRAYARAWGDPSVKQGDVAFFAELVGGRGTERLAAEQALRPAGVLHRHGLLQLAPDRAWMPRAPLLYLRAKLGPRVASFLQGEMLPARRVLPAAVSVARRGARLEELVLMAGVAERVQGGLAAAVQNDGTCDPVCLIAPRHSGRKALVAALSPEAPLVVVNAAALPKEVDAFEQVIEEALCEAVLQGGMLYLDNAEALSGTEQAPLRSRLSELLDGVKARFVMGLDGTLEGWSNVLPRLVSVVISMPDAATQLALWSRLLPLDVQLAPACDLESVTARYSLPAGMIHSCVDDLVRNARARDSQAPVIELADALSTVRRELGNRFGDLAQHVATTFTWDDLVLPDDILNRIFEVVLFSQHRETILRDWGFERKLPYGRSISVLLAGEPGTGKTMVASLLARELGLELFRVNVSKVVDKYIGETEKNLARIFDEARRGQVALLFDEADSLFSRRTQVQSSNDRYSNLAVNYLLQAVESHDGVILLTTNHEKAIDPAFRRRIRFRVSFPFPSENERAMLWQSMLPAEAALEGKVDWAALGRDFNMTGGPIKNAVVRAALHAAARGTSIDYGLLREGARMEYEELGHLVAGKQKEKE